MKNSSAEPNCAPEHNQLEVSLFGPGVGECIVLHLGDGVWAIIDSCIGESGVPVALEYLQSLGVDPGTAVRFIIISHWHDDHIRGVSELVKVCISAKVILSAALLKKEFITLADAMNDPISEIDRGQSGLNELNKVITQLHLRGNSNKPENYLGKALADRRIYVSGDVELWTLSPSDHDFTNAILEFSSLTNSLTAEYRGVIPAPSSNRNAVVVWFSFGDISILLGADLENTPIEQCGWAAIVNSAGRPQKKALIFKVPHHGSENAHNDAVIEKLLNDEPFSILTTYNRGCSPLPKQSDIKRIKSYSRATYATTVPKTKLPKRGSTVEKEIKAVVTSRRAIGRGIGHICIRATRGSEPVIRTMGNASRL